MEQIISDEKIKESLTEVLVRIKFGDYRIGIEIIESEEGFYEIFT